MPPHLDGVIAVQYDFLKKSCLECKVINIVALFSGQIHKNRA